ncbi:MAG: ATP-binding protein [Planctomycetaceae bacterium]|nr:ATP-binding protein [Planctomycetaceae bacterium]
MVMQSMASLLAKVNGSLALPPASASSEAEDIKPRRLTKEEAERAITSAIRLHDDWGGQWDFHRRLHTGPVPPLAELVRRELPDNADPEQVTRIIAAADAAQQRREEAQRKARLDAFTATVGKRFAGATLDSYQVTCPEQTKVLATIRSYAANIRERVADGAGIVMFGSAGSGKTHLLSALGKLAIDAGLTVTWTNGQDLFARFRAAIDGDESEGKIIDDLVAADALVLDDLLPPGGSLSDYQATSMYRIIDARYRDCRPTWVSMNVAAGDEAERGMGAQVVDRLRHGSLTLFCNWPSYRKPQA